MSTGSVCHAGIFPSLSISTFGTASAFLGLSGAPMTALRLAGLFDADTFLFSLLRVDGCARAEAWGVAFVLFCGLGGGSASSSADRSNSSSSDSGSAYSDRFLVAACRVERRADCGRAMAYYCITEQYST